MMKTNLHLILMRTILILISLFICHSIFAQRSALTNLKIIEANWESKKELKIIYKYKIINPAPLEANSRAVQFVGDNYDPNSFDNGTPTTFRYYPRSVSSNGTETLHLGIPKQFIEVGKLVEFDIIIGNLEYSRLTYQEQSKLTSKLPGVIRTRVSIKFVNNNGFLEVEGVPNTNPQVIQTPVSITLPTNLFVEIDKNPRTDQPWECIAADGRSSVRIAISAPGAESVTYSLPESQGIIDPSWNLSKGQVTHAKGKLKLYNGKGDLYFHPPKFTPENKSFMTKRVVQNRILRYYESEITISLTDKNGQEKEVKKKIQYCRAPVFLVHGFTGDKSTWELLDQLLSQKGFFTHRENYYMTSTSNGTQDIQTQAQFLGQMIREEMLVYEKSNVMFRKVDIVAHSMGGLISRYYAKNYSQYADDVRKIIMVGTPNHGIFSSVDLFAGKMASAWSDSHKGMAQNVAYDSDVMKQINNGESSGGHLNPQIQYGNIYVEGTDGVVEGRSARLNGVKEAMLTKMKHSPAIPQIPGIMDYGNKSITTEWMVFGKILGWLNNPIEAGKLNMNQWNKNSLVSAGDEVDLSGLGHFLKVHSGEIHLNKDLKRFSSQAGTNAEITYPDGTVIKILPNIKMAYNDNLNELLITKGTVVTNVKKQKGKFVVISPTLRAGVRGTCFEVEVSESGNTKIPLYEGELEITNLSGTQFIRAGEYMETGDPNKLYKRTFNPEQRFNQLWSGFPGMSDLNSFMGKRHPLFANVTTGGNLANPGQLKPSGSSGNIQNCLNSLTPKFLQKIAATADPQGQMIVRKLDNDNKREVSLFNQAKNNFKKGIVPLEMNGRYTYQQNPSILAPNYNCPTVTLFTPMKITAVGGSTQGFKLLREGRDYKEFGTNSDANGTVLPCGSYRAYPNEDRRGATVIVKLKKAY